MHLERHATPGCPVEHASLPQGKTARSPEPAGPPLSRDELGTWHVRGYSQARTLLRSSHTRQAGFKAELMAQLPATMRLPILYQDGPDHRQQRKQTARFFTPAATSANYRQMMEALAEKLVARLRRQRQADLSQLSLEMAVAVAGQVVGLTGSRLPGMDRRLNRFFRDDLAPFGWRPGQLWTFVRSQVRLFSFFLLDVLPAIRARRKQPREDLISYLITQGYSPMEILTECVTFGAAGMVTTREFICLAAWHLLEQPELRRRFLQGGEATRHRLLHEMLRLEPVVGHLYRRATADLPLEAGGQAITIPAGALIDLHIYAINADAAVVGEQPLRLCPERQVAGGVHPAVMGFGDGHHRCPGAYVAIQESDIFLQRLLALPGLRLEKAPTLSWNRLIEGYELRAFRIVAG